MRKGTIVYLTESTNINDEFDDKTAINQLGLEADYTIVAASKTGFYNLEDAARLLIVRGAKYVEAICASVTKDGSIIKSGQVMRIFG